MPDGLLLHGFASGALKPALLEGETDPKQGWVSGDYGLHQPAPVLVYSLIAMLPARLITLLVPTDALSSPPPSVSPLTEDGWLRGLIFEDDGEVFRADDLMGGTPMP